MNINNNIKTLVKNFDIYVNNIEKNAKRHSKINDKDFRYKVQEFGDSFTNSNELPKFNKTAQKFAEKLVSLNNDKLAGIIYETAFLSAFHKTMYFGICFGTICLICASIAYSKQLK